MAAHDTRALKALLNRANQAIPNLQAENASNVLQLFAEALTAIDEGCSKKQIEKPHEPSHVHFYLGDSEERGVTKPTRPSRNSDAHVHFYIDGGITTGGGTPEKHVHFHLDGQIQPSHSPKHVHFHLTQEEERPSNPITRSPPLRHLPPSPSASPHVPEPRHRKSKHTEEPRPRRVHSPPPSPPSLPPSPPSRTTRERRDDAREHKHEESQLRPSRGRVMPPKEVEFIPREPQPPQLPIRHNDYARQWTPSSSECSSVSSSDSSQDYRMRRMTDVSPELRHHHHHHYHRHPGDISPELLRGDHNPHTRFFEARAISPSRMYVRERVMPEAAAAAAAAIAPRKINPPPLDIGEPGGDSRRSREISAQRAAAAAAARSVYSSEPTSSRSSAYNLSSYPPPSAAHEDTESSPESPRNSRPLASSSSASASAASSSSSSSRRAPARAPYSAAPRDTTQEQSDTSSCSEDEPTPPSATKVRRDYDQKYDAMYDDYRYRSNYSTSTTSSSSSSTRPYKEECPPRQIVNRVSIMKSTSVQEVYGADDDDAVRGPRSPVLLRRHFDYSPQGW